METGGPLARYLRARRALVEPADVSLPTGNSPRRVPGLRREEVAMLAGISSDYYLRLEQGRELHPSASVLEGLTRALCLDRESASYLYRVARPALAAPSGLDDSVSSSVTALIDSMTSIPAFVVNRYLDIIWVNPLALVLSQGFRCGSNLVKLMFDPSRPRDAYWRTSARRAVGFLRSSVDPLDDSPEFARLLEDLYAIGPEFTDLWQLHDSHGPSGHPTAFNHETVGLMELRMQTFGLPGTGGQMVVMFIAPPGGPSAEKLERLSLMTDRPGSAPGGRPAPRKTGTTPGR